MEQDLTKEPTTSPNKTPVNVRPKLSQAGASSSAAKVVVFTPEQLQKLDFAKQLQDVINKQVNPLYIKEIKRGPYKKRHPKLVKNKNVKPKQILCNEQSSESITTSLKQKFSQVVKLDKNLLTDSVNSECSVGENIQSDVKDEDVVKCEPLNVKKGQVIQETMKLKRQILNKNAVDSCDVKDDNDKSSKASDDVELNIKQEVIKNLFNVKIRQTGEAVKKVQQSKDDEVIPEILNSNESKSSLNGSEINEEVEKVMAIPEVLTTNDYVIEENEDIQSELIQNKKDTIHDKTNSSEIIQNEANVPFELVKPHQTKEQSVTVGETMEEIAEEVKQINANQKLRIQETEIDGTKKEENRIACINQKIQNEEPVPEIVQLKSQSSQHARINKQNSQDTIEDVEKLNRKNPVSPIIPKKTSQSQSIRIDYAESNENSTEIKKLSTEEKEVIQNTMEENEIESFVVSEVIQAKSLLTRRNSRKKTEEICDEPKEELVKEFTKLHEKEEVVDKHQSKQEELVPVAKQLSTRRQSARNHKGRVQDEAEEKKIGQIGLNEEFGNSNVGQLKSPLQRRLSVRIDYAKDNGNIHEIKKLHETEKQEEAPLLTRRSSVNKGETDEELAISNFEELKSPSKRRLSIRIDYAKSNENIEEVKKPNEIERQGEEKEMEKHQYLNKEFAVSNVDQLQSPPKRRLSVRIDYAKGKKLTEEEGKKCVVVEKKEEAVVPDVVQSKATLTRRQSLRKDKAKEQKIEGSQYVNEDAGQLKSPSKRRLSLRIDYVKNNENIKEFKKLTEEEKEAAQNKRRNVIGENEKAVPIVTEVVQSNPLLTRIKSEGNSDKHKDEVDRRRPSVTNENAKSSLRKSQDTRTDNKEEKCEEEGRKAAQKKKPQRQSERMSETEKNTTKKNTVAEVSPVNKSRISEILIEKDHTDDKEKQSNENEKAGAHPEIRRLKPQLKRRRNARIYEIKNDDTKQENEEIINHNRSETKKDVIEEAEQLEETGTSQLIYSSKSIVDPVEEESKKIKLRTYQNRSKKGLKNNDTKEADQKPNQKDILESLELIPSQKAEKSLKTNDCKLNEIVTDHLQHEEDIADSCSVEEMQKVNQLEETEKKKSIQIVTNEVVFFSPSDIQNMTKNPNCKPVALAADPALVILQKSANSQEVIIRENKSENKKLSEEAELILKEEKAQPRCYTRKNKTNVDQNLFAQGNKKNEKVSTTISTDSTIKHCDEVKVEEEKREFVNVENTLFKNVDEPIKIPEVAGSRSKSLKKTETSNETDSLDSIQMKSGLKRKLATLVESDKKCSANTDEPTKLSDNTEILQKTSGKTLTSNTEVIETVVSEPDLSVNAESLEDDSLSSKTTKSAENKEIKQNLPRTSRRFIKSSLTANIEVVETRVPEENLPVNSEAHEHNSLSSGTTKLDRNKEILQKSLKKTSNSKNSTELVETVKSETNSPVKTKAPEENSETKTAGKSSLIFDVKIAESENLPADDSLSSKTTKLAGNAEILQTSTRKSGRSRKSTLNSKIKVVEPVESKVNLPVIPDVPESDSLTSETIKVVGNSEILQKSPKKAGKTKKSTLISETELVETVESEANLPVNTDAPQKGSLGFETSKLVLKNIEVLQELPKKKGRPRKSTLISNTELMETEESETNSSVNTETLQKNSMGLEASKLVLKKTEILLEPPKKKGRPRKSSVNTETLQNNSASSEASQLLLENIKILQEPPKRRGRPSKSAVICNTEVIETVQFEANLPINADTPEDDSWSSETSQLNKESSSKVGRTRKSTPICKSKLVEIIKSEANLLVETESHSTMRLAEDTEILQKTPKKKGRPRKSTTISKTGVIETSEFQSNLSLKSETVETTPRTPTTSGRSKRKRKVVDYSKLSRTNESEEENDVDFVLKKPKKRKKLDQDIFEIDVDITPNPQTEEVDCSFSEVNKRNRKGQSKNAKLFYSLVNDAKLNDTSHMLNEETVSSDQVNVGVKIKQEKNKSNSSVVTCDVCKLEMEKKDWVNHKLKKHNNLAWKVGDKPLDLNDSKFVLSVLNEMYINKKNHYYCDKCENVSRSVQGYLSHRSRCQKSTQDLIALQVTCEHCERVMLPVSMYTHLKFCRGLKPNDEDLEKTKVEEDSPLPRKRKAAEKASQFITALNEEDDQPKEKNFKYSKKWIENYNFDVVPWAKKIILEQCRENGSAKCCFKGCEYQNSDWSEMFSHFKECTKKLEGFSCKLCLSIFETKPGVIEHLKENHIDEFKTDINFDDEESNDSYDEDNEEENCKRRKDNKGSANFSLFKQTFLLKFSKDLCPISVSKSMVFPSAWKWTFDFCRENFSEPNLFSDWRNSPVQNLNSYKIGTYLPKQKYSVCTSIIKCQKYIDPLASDYDWKRFCLFETSQSDSGVFSIFCGGSISAMAWLPTPYTTQICEQILAVAVQPGLETVYKVNQFYSDPGIIQFWNCGSFETAPKLQFCIAHDYNPIWCLEWCPSGCYDVEVKENESRRLGILAVGSGNSNVYLYSVSEPPPTSEKLIKVKPIKQLSLIINTEQCSATLKPHVSKISWTKAAGHQHIAVGYTNGVVALYNLSNLSDLLKYKVDNELEAQQPYLTINAHVHSVTALTLSHINGGCRWLMTASADRTIKYWDLKEPSTPITSSSKFVVTDGVWLTHWLCSILCFDDSCNTGITQTSLHQVRNFKSDTCNVMHSNSAIQCISANDWINGLIQGNAAGEIQAFFPHQLLHGMDNNSKHFKKKKVILSYCRVVEKNISIEERLARENEKLKLMVSKPIEVVDMSKIASNPNRYKPEPTTYKGAENKYGVVFCDYQLNKVEQIPATFTDYTNSHKEKYYPTRPNLYPMQCVTKVQFNPNRSSYNYFAAGYQIGFVRLYPMKFITTK